MTRFTRLISTLLLLLSSLALIGARPYQDTDPMHEDHVLMAKLSGAAEVPGPGDPNGKGQAKITLTMDGETHLVCWKINVKDIVLPATAAHIHLGAAGVAGPVVVPLSPPDSSGKSSGCVAVSHELHHELHMNAAGYYVNVHNSVYPAGALRGQIRLTIDD